MIDGKFRVGGEPRFPSNVLSEACPSRAILQHVTSRWGILCLFVLRNGTLRFSEIRDRIGGVSERMLSQTLKNLVDDGFVERKARPVVPPHVDYSLSEAGIAVAEKLTDLIHWIEHFNDLKPPSARSGDARLANDR